jgi:hypothetical protein
VWRRSTDEGSATATPAEPRFDAGPPSSPPPAHAPGQRRFNFLIVGLTILLAAALVAGLVVYNHYGSSKAVTPSADAGVKQAYLEFFSATTSALRSLNVTPLQDFVTSAGLKQQQDGIAQAAKAGHPFQVTADHDLQVVVYSGGDLASVDDVMSRHTVPLDQTMAPIGPDSPDWLHDSVVLVKQNGHWLVDSVVGFGTDSTEPGSRVSYAAAARGNRLPDQIRRQVQQSYLAYWNASKKALAEPDAAPLDRYEIDPKLSQDRLFVKGLIQKGQSYVIGVEHNFRVAQQDDSTVWIYDSIADSSYTVDASSKQPINRVPVQVTRKSLRFKKVGDQWKLDFDVLDQ